MAQHQHPNIQSTHSSLNSWCCAAYVCKWMSGHEQPKPVYLRITKEWPYGGTYNIEEATLFKTQACAFKAYLGGLTYPDDYEKYIHDGTVTAEPINQPSLF